MPYNYYNCKQCGRDIKRKLCGEDIEAPSQIEEIKCECGNTKLTYRGYEDEKGWYFHYVPEQNTHYVYNSKDNGLYWYNQVDQKWSHTGRTATVMLYSPPTTTLLFGCQEVFSGFQTETNASFQELEYEAKGTFPQSDRDLEYCLKELRGYGLKTEKDKGLAVRMITAQVVGSKDLALEILAQWNKAYPKQLISSQDVGLDAIVQSQSDYKMEIETVNEGYNNSGPAATITVNYNGYSHTLTLFSETGGYHLIYSPTGVAQMVNKVQNSEILVRMPRKNTIVSPSQGAQNGFYWKNNFGIDIPYIYNFNTLNGDNFYIVEKVPLQFTPSKKAHLEQVKKFLGTMSAQGSGPDFRPDNVRFRSNGEMVLIDFSENPAVQGINPSDFAGLMKDFTLQFANCDKTDIGLYDELRKGMSPQFRQEMDNALMSWYQ
ncbi:MAG TPA: hypothetical protein VJ810_29390 [Blastocatellia bacterium]|nr:hypothetical protein [Blastocatellia bacterium]